VRRGFVVGAFVGMSALTHSASPEHFSAAATTIGLFASVI